jgi:hypothetical protein
VSPRTGLDDVERNKLLPPTGTRTLTVASRYPQDCWVLALWPSSGILKNTKAHNVSETGCVSGVGDTYSVASVRRS